MDTNQLIEQLAENGDPVQRLATPWTRTAVWLLIAAPYVVMIVFMMALRNDLTVKFSESRFLLEQVAALCTAITAAVAAFTSIVPGYDRRLMLMPLIPLGVWLASLGQGCVQTWMQGGTGLSLASDWACIPTIALVGIVPAVAMALMLRKGAPLTPHVSAALGGLAAAGLGDFGLRLFHYQDASMMVLVWQMGTVIFLTMMAASTGRIFLDWRPLLANVRRNVKASS